jgi:hypothetical protein
VNAHRASPGPIRAGCHNFEPWQTTLRGLVTYTVPKIDVLVSAVLRSQPPQLLGGDAETTASWIVPNSVIAAALGTCRRAQRRRARRRFTLGDNEHRIYADNRRSQIDMRFAKIVRFGRYRTDIGVDLNNLTNTNYSTGTTRRTTTTPDRRRGRAVGNAHEHLQSAVRASELHGEFLRKVRIGGQLQRPY